MVLVFKKGDDFLEELKKRLAAQKANSGFFYGLGGFVNPELAYYDLANKKFINKQYRGFFEVTNLTGNLAQLDGKPYLHCHVTLGDKKFAAIGGHLVSAKVGGLMEIVVTPTELLKRKYDKETGLNLMQ